jgi:hypothetical protein
MKKWCAFVAAVVMMFGAGAAWAHPSGDAPSVGDAAAPSADGPGANSGDSTDQGVSSILGPGYPDWRFASPGYPGWPSAYPSASPGTDRPPYRARPVCVGYYAPTGGLPCR